jgi:hypothetical protein
MRGRKAQLDEIALLLGKGKKHRQGHRGKERRARGAAGGGEKGREQTCSWCAHALRRSAVVTSAAWTRSLTQGQQQVEQRRTQRGESFECI